MGAVHGFKKSQPALRGDFSKHLLSKNCIKGRKYEFFVNKKTATCLLQVAVFLFLWRALN
jgi:hypothetical protein